MDPLEPLLQHLVQDKAFSSAVQGTQLHAAAAAALKVLKASDAAAEKKQPAFPLTAFLPSLQTYGSPVLLGSGDGFKRPADRAFMFDPGSGGYPPAGGVRSMKAEVLQLEESIPWTMVRRNWRNKRSLWRRQVKQTELVADFAARLKELRAALLADDHSLQGCGPGWRAHLDSCAAGRGTAAALAAVWDDLKTAIRLWMSGGGGGVGPSGTPGGPAGGYAALHAGPAPSAASTGRAVTAMQAAVKAGGADALLQAPLESIMGHDGASLHAVRQAIELERRVVAGRLAGLQGSAPGSPTVGDCGGGMDGWGTNGGGAMVSYFSSIAATWEDSDFDSGADTEMDDASDATDLDSDFDA